MVSGTAAQSVCSAEDKYVPADQTSAICDPRKTNTSVCMGGPREGGVVSLCGAFLSLPSASKNGLALAARHSSGLHRNKETTTRRKRKINE